MVSRRNRLIAPKRRMKTVLVTGGSGFIGAKLIQSLVTDGVKVKATSRSAKSDEFLKSLGATTHAWSLEENLLSPDLMDNVDVVFHLACPRRSWDPKINAMRRTDSPELVTGTVALSERFLTSKASRFVLASSCSVYGKSWGVKTEDDPVKPETGYARSRAMTEAALDKIFVSEPDRLTITRLTETFGKGSLTQRHVFEQIRSGNFRIIGNGSALHHFSHVDDVVAGLIACSMSKNAAGKTLNIGSNPRSFMDFVSAASSAVKQPVKASPFLQIPAVLALRLLIRSRTLQTLLPSLYSSLNYQLRPSAFDIGQSIASLGTYQKANFDEAVADAIQASTDNWRELSALSAERNSVK